MTILRHTRAIQLRAAGALLALLLGWLSAPLEFAAYEADVCTMECCIAVGHCCCTPRHHYVKGEIPSGREELGRPDLNRSCPRGCSTPGVSSSTFVGTIAREDGHQFEAAVKPPVPRVRLSRSDDPLHFDIASPRAPPVSALRQS